MGFSTIIDLIGSSVIFGWLFLITLTAKQANNEDLQTNQGELLCQQNLVELTKLLEYDFRKIGYCKEPDRLPNPTLAILLADSTKIKFLTDLDIDGTGPDGIVDSLYYYLGTTGGMMNNANTRPMTPRMTTTWRTRFHRDLHIIGGRKRSCRPVIATCPGASRSAFISAALA